MSINIDNKFTNILKHDPEDWQKLNAASKAFAYLSSFGITCAYGLMYATNQFPVQSTIYSRLFYATGAFWAFAGGPYLMSAVSAQPLNTLTNALAPFSKYLYVSPELAKFQNYYNRFQDMKAYISDINIKKLEGFLKDYKIRLYDPNDNEWKHIIIRKNAQFLDLVFGILERPKNIQPTLTDAEINAQLKIKTKKLMEILDTYPEQREAIKDFAKIVGYYQLRNKDYQSVRSLYLQGPPGVGKTKLIEQVCALYDIPMIIRKGKSTISYAWAERQVWEDVENQKVSVLGQALNATRKDGYDGYVVVFFDELDKLPRLEGGAGAGNGGTPSLQDAAQTLLDLTDNDQKWLNDIYTGLDYPKEKVIVVIAVNDCILEFIPGLGRRVEKIEFGNMSAETKQQVALGKLETLCAAENVQKEALVDTVKTMVQNDTEPGVGELVERVKGLVLAVATNDLHKDTELAEEPQAILNRFAQFKAQQPNPFEIKEEQEKPESNPAEEKSIPGPALTITR